MLNLQENGKTLQEFPTFPFETFVPSMSAS